MPSRRCATPNRAISKWRPAASLSADGQRFIRKKESAQSYKLLLRGDDELRRILAAHAVDCTGCARTDRVGVAARLLRHNRHRSVRAARNRSARVKRRRGAEVQDESGIFRRALECNGGTRLHTEWGIGLSIRD